LHAAATAKTARVGDALVTTDWVLIELADAMCRARHRVLAAEFIRDLRDDSRITIVPLSSELLQAGFDLYAARNDKDWSLTDCISFVVMRERGLTEALTADHHFEQAGFAALLK
jgi:uncharacterized protein